MTTITKISIAVLMAFGLVMPFLAQEGDKPETTVKTEPATTTITADSIRYNRLKGVAIYEGNVVVVDPQVDIFADRMTVTFRKKNTEKDKKTPDPKPKPKAKGLAPMSGVGGSVEKIVCETLEPDSRVIILNKKDKAKATGKNAVYTLGNELLVLTGDAKLYEENGVLSAKIIEYNRATGDLLAKQGQLVGKVEEKKKPEPEKK